MMLTFSLNLTEFGRARSPESFLHAVSQCEEDTDRRDDIHYKTEPKAQRKNCFEVGENKE